MRKLTWFSFALMIACYIVLPIQDPDLGWHITVGRWILGHGKIPDHDMWNLFADGAAWRAYSWSSEIIFALVDRYWQIQGLLVLKIILALCLSLSLFYCYGKIAKDWLVGALLGIFAMSATYNHFTLRPQTILWIFFTWQIYTVNQIDKEGLTNKRRLALVLLFCAWANTHLSAALGIMTVALWLFDIKNKKLAVEACLWSFLGTLITPYLGGEWLTFLSKTGHPFEMSAIAEFKPATILQYSTGFLVLSTSLLVLCTHFRPRLLSIGKGLLCLCFIVGSLAVLKFLPMAVILICALIALCWANSADDRSCLLGLSEGIERLRKVYDFVPKDGLTFLCLCFSVVCIYPEWNNPQEYSANPVPAVNFIEKHNLPHPYMHGFGQGGYFMYRFSDRNGNLEHKVVIDGRTNVNPPEIWQAFMSALEFKHNWRDFFDLVKPETILWKNESPLKTYLMLSPEWQRVCYFGPSNRDEDSGYSVFVKSDYAKEHNLSDGDCNR